MFIFVTSHVNCIVTSICVWNWSLKLLVWLLMNAKYCYSTFYSYVKAYSSSCIYAIFLSFRITRFQLCSIASAPSGVTLIKYFTILGGTGHSTCVVKQTKYYAKIGRKIFPVSFPLTYNSFVYKFVIRIHLWSEKQNRAALLSLNVKTRAVTKTCETYVLVYQIRRVTFNRTRSVRLCRSSRSSTFHGFVWSSPDTKRF